MAGCGGGLKFHRKAITYNVQEPKYKNDSFKLNFYFPGGIEFFFFTFLEV